MLSDFVVATRSRKQTHSEGRADSGAQFITPAGPMKSLLLAKDPRPAFVKIFYTPCGRV